MHDPFAPSRVSPPQGSLALEEAEGLLSTRTPASLDRAELAVDSGELTSEDIFEGRSREQLGVANPSLKSIRFTHHRIAQLLAGGLPTTTVAALTNYHPSRISILKQSPAFQELLAHYEGESQAEIADFVDAAKGLSMDMLHLLQEKIDEHPEQFTPSMLGELIKVLADRSGNAPVTKTQNVNVNVDMGTKLRLARERAAQIERATIEGEFRETGT